MRKKDTNKKINKTWDISEEDKQIFLGAMKSLGNDQDSLTEKKFDFIKEKSFSIRKRKSTFRESGEKIQAKLDLHGLAQYEVTARLDEFCEQCAHKILRTVIVITGKGLHSLRGKSILKEHVIHWLNSKRGRHFVEFYRPASRQEGGKGALVLYLHKDNVLK
ncbi:MAG: Smr/MutS family protein [bacterium]